MKKGKQRQMFAFIGMMAAVVLLTAFLVKACNYLLVDDAQSYTRLTMHELYENEENIDTVFIGASHCFRAYDPALFTELTGKSSFNLGSSAQHYDTTYYLLREAARYNDIQTVYLDMTYKFLLLNREGQDLVQANIISDYMRPSLNKLEFITATSEARHYTNRFLPFRREWQKLGDLSYLKEVWAKKQTEEYKSYAPIVREQEHYVGKGFVYAEEELDAEAITWWDNFTPIADDMAGEGTYMLSYIDKIVEFCKERGIRLIFVTPPYYDRYLEQVGPYDQAYGFVRELAEQYEVPYLDFNLCREEYLNLDADSFLDVDHLNGKGAKAVTRLLAQLDADPEHVDEYFKSWYDETSSARAKDR